MSGGSNKRPITILQVIGSMDRGGAETFLMNVLRNIDRKQFRLVFLCFGNDKFDYEDELTSFGAKIRRVPSIDKKRLIKSVTDVMKVIKEEEVDIVHAHIYYDSAFSILAARFTGIKVRIVHSHASGMPLKLGVARAVYYMTQKLIIRQLSSSRIACGDDAGNSLFGNHPFSVVPNGIEVSRFLYSATTNESLRRVFSIPTDAVVIGHVGRMDTSKNQKFAIEVFNVYHSRNLNSYLLLVGDGPLRSELEQVVSSYDLKGYVKFLGKRVDVNELYSFINLFLFPSLYEGLGIVLVEAQANGLRCLVSDSVPVEVKLTDTLEFYSLSKTTAQWAKKIKSMDLSRLDTGKALKDGPYDIKVGVKVIEKLYADSLRSQ